MVVGCQVSVMSIFEYYRMGIPMFAPSPALLARWQVQHRYDLTPTPLPPPCLPHHLQPLADAAHHQMAQPRLAG